MLCKVLLLSMMMMRRKKILYTLGSRFTRIIDGGWDWTGHLHCSRKRGPVGGLFSILYSGESELTDRCDSHLLPVSPPASFSLPPSASIVLPAPTKSDPHAKVKRTATWKWLDDDWSIVRAGQGQSSSITVQAPSPIEPESSFSHIPRSLSISLGSSPPHVEDGPRTQSIAEQAFTKGLERLKARTITPQGKQTSPRSSVEMVRPRTGSGASEDLEGVQMQGMTGAANPASHVPTETIREKDDVSISYLVTNRS